MLVQHKQKDKMCKLLKPLYGLKHSSRKWYKKLDNFIVENGGRCISTVPYTYVVMSRFGNTGKFLEDQHRTHSQKGRIW